MSKKSSIELPNLLGSDLFKLRYEEKKNASERKALGILASDLSKPGLKGQPMGRLNHARIEENEFLFEERSARRKSACHIDDCNKIHITQSKLKRPF